MNKLSELAWLNSQRIIDAIKLHPFNTELAAGSLDISKFAYYVEQDRAYLHSYAKTMAIIAARVPTKYAKDFLAFSEGSLAETEVLHAYFRTTFDVKETTCLTPASICYTSYLLKTASIAPIEVAIASILPCFWVYNEIGLSIADEADGILCNPFSLWIETYASEEFSTSVERVIEIFDEMGASASDDIQEAMLEAFYTSTVLEWHFWNDAYNQIVFDVIA